MSLWPTRMRFVCSMPCMLARPGFERTSEQVSSDRPGRPRDRVASRFPGEIGAPVDLGVNIIAAGR
jgi:hypothetical protein